jgi:peptidoglycan hydrolase CwlO-like protein
MNTQFTILAQSANSAMAEIALLLVVAVIIGFLTAWFYQKSVFIPIIKGLETDKENLNKKIAELNSEISTLKSKIGELENSVTEKNKEIELLKKPKK